MNKLHYRQRSILRDLIAIILSLAALILFLSEDSKAKVVAEAKVGPAKVVLAEPAPEAADGLRPDRPENR